MNLAILGFSLTILCGAGVALGAVIGKWAMRKHHRRSESGWDKEQIWDP